MHPEYRLRLLTGGRNYNSLHDLIEEAYKAQAEIKMDRTYREPRTYNNIEPSLAYKLPQESKDKQSAYKKPLYVMDSSKGVQKSYGVQPLQTSSFDRFSHYHPRYDGHNGYGYSNRSWTRENSKSGGADSKHSASSSRGSHNSYHGNNSSHTTNHSVHQMASSTKTEPSSHDNNNKRKAEQINANGLRGACFVCEKFGHYKRDCPVWAKQKKLSQGN